MRVENLTWIGEPSYPYDKKLKMWPRWTLWPFKIKDCDMVFYMNKDDYEIYQAEKAILDNLNLILLPEQKEFVRPELMKLIEAYGNKREEKGRSDVREDWAESDAGASL